MGGPKGGWGWASGNLQCGENCVAQVDGISGMAPTCQLCGWLCWGRAQKRNSGLCQYVSLGESCPPALILMSYNSVPPCMSLVSFNLLPPCWSSQGVTLSKFMHGPFKRNLQGVQQLLSSTASIPAEFYSQKLWQLLFLALELWAMDLV